MSALEDIGLERDVRIGLVELLKSRELCDVRLHGFMDQKGIGRLEQIHAHKVVLALRSKVLKERLCMGGEWFGRSEVVCDIVTDFRVMDSVVWFMYTDEIDFGPESDLGRLSFAVRVQTAAQKLKIPLLERLSSNAVQETIGCAAQLDPADENWSVAKTRWFSHVLGVLQFAVRMNPTDGCADPELAKFCLDAIKTEFEKSEWEKPCLLRAMHDPVQTFTADFDTMKDRCAANVCSDILLAVSPVREHAMTLAVLTGRADIVVDLMARGLDPDAPSANGALPVETALQVGRAKGKKMNRPHSSLEMHSQGSLGQEEEEEEEEDYDELDEEDNLEGEIDDEEDRESDPEEPPKIQTVMSPSSPPSPSSGLDFTVDWATLEEMDHIAETLILGGSRDARGRSRVAQIAQDRSDSSKQQHPMLNLAAKLGNARHVQALLAAGLDVNELDPVSGRSALHCAAETGFENVVRVLLDAGAVFNQQDINGCTALHLACRRGHLSIVEILQPLVNENIPDRFGWTSLHHAARKGHAEVTRQLLQQSKRPMSFLLANEYEQGSTAVHLAACNAHYRVILVMLDCARELDHQQSQDPGSFSKSPSVSGKSNLLATVNCRDMTGRTPLHRASTSAYELISMHGQSSDSLKRCFKVIESLLDAGADVNTGSKLGYVALHFALGGQNSHILDQSSESKSKVNGAIVGGADAASVSSGVISLLQQQQDLSQQLHDKTRDRNIALLLSILIGAPGGMVAIQTAGVDRITPLHCAVRYGLTSAVPKLIRHGADINAMDSNGESPLSIARDQWPLPLLANAMLKVLPTPPSWVEDSQVDHCQSCGTHFSVTTRRHHCRHCSSLVCSTCSNHWMAIPKYKIEKPVRVCNGCHEALSWPSPILDEEDDIFEENSLDSSQDLDSSLDAFPVEENSDLSNVSFNGQQSSFPRNISSTASDTASTSESVKSATIRPRSVVTHSHTTVARTENSSPPVNGTKVHIRVRPRKAVRQVTLS